MDESAGYEAGQQKSVRPPGSILVEDFPELWGRSPCLDFVNSWMTEHTGTGETFDLLPLPGWQGAFRSLWKLPLDDADEVPPLTAMVDVRRMVRDGLERWGRNEELAEADVRELNTILRLAPLNRTVRPDEAGYKLELAPSAHNWTWILTEVIASMFKLMAEGDPNRLRKCHNPECSWLYYDDSQGRSRRWCSPRACGNMVRVRRFRTRQKQSGTRGSRRQ